MRVSFAIQKVVVPSEFKWGSTSERTGSGMRLDVEESTWG